MKSGTCAVCRGKVTETKTDVSRTVMGRDVQILGVPAFSCSDCGEMWFVARVMKQVDRLIDSNPEASTIAYRENAHQWYDQTLKRVASDQKVLEDVLRKMTMEASTVAVKEIVKAILTKASEKRSTIPHEILQPVTQVELFRAGEKSLH